MGDGGQMSLFDAHPRQIFCEISDYKLWTFSSRNPGQARLKCQKAAIQICG